MKRFSLALLALAGLTALAPAPASAQAIRSVQSKPNQCYIVRGEHVCDIQCQPNETILMAVCNKHAKPGPVWGQGGEVQPTYHSRSTAQCRTPEKPGFGDPVVALCVAFRNSPAPSRQERK